jgi:hypothetical protein
MLCDVLLCDGEPFMYGGNDKDIPDTQGPFPVPGVIRGYEIVKQSIVDSIKPTDVGGGVVIGYFYQSRTSSGNDAWNFGEAPEPGTPDRQRAAMIYEAYKAGQLPTHVPTEAVANPVQPAFSNGTPYNNPMGMHQNPYGQPYAAPQAPVAPVSVPMGGQMTFNAPTTTGNPAAQPVMGTPQVPGNAVPPGYTFGQQPMPVQQQSPAFDFSSIVSPQGVATPIDAAPQGAPQNVIDAWPSLSPQQKDQVRQQLAQMAAQQGGPSYP